MFIPGRTCYLYTLMANEFTILFFVQLIPHCYSFCNLVLSILRSSLSVLCFTVSGLLREGFNVLLSIWCMKIECCKMLPISWVIAKCIC